MTTVPNIKLSSGYDMPQVGFGLWKVDNAICADTVYNAIKAGYRLFDGACDYGNEVEVGQGIARAIKDGLVKREDLFVTSKLWQTFHDGDKVEGIARKQLADLGLEYFDLFLIHFPIGLEYVDPSVRYPPGWQVDGDKLVKRSKASMQETWVAMEGLVEKKLARSIGTSNTQSQLLYDMLTYAKIPPAALQIEHHPYLTQPDLIALCKEEGIAVTAYSSFGPASFDEFDWSHTKAIQPLLKSDLITSIADKHGKTTSQVLLRWATQRGLAVIPKTNHPERLAQNLDCTSFDLSEEDIKKISSLNGGLRFNKPTHYFESEKLYIFG